MTDKTSAPDLTTEPTPADTGTRASASTRAANKADPAKRSSGPLGIALILVLALAAGLGYLLWKQRVEAVAAGHVVAQRLDTLSSTLTQARNDTREALALAQSQAGRVAQLESTVQEVRSQNSALQQALQNMNDSASDELLANDVERLLNIANQQLRLAGSVSNAIIALETAQSRLARANRPRFASLQQAINGDLDRLRAVPSVDISTQSARIERLSALISQAPLLVPDAVAPQVVGPQTTAVARAPAATTLPDNASWWQRWREEVLSWPSRAGSALVQELGSLITIQRVDEPSALLLSVEQADQLRAMLRQRLLTVRLAMLMRQSDVWKNELDHVGQAVSTYFDARSPDTLAAQTVLRELSQTAIAAPIPEVADSLDAMAALRAAGFNRSEQD